jgi:hypothetical protein
MSKARWWTMDGGRWLIHTAVAFIDATVHRPSSTVLLLLLSLLLLPAPAQAQESLPDLAAYEALAREALAAARRGDRLGLEEAAGRMAAISAVQSADGQRLPVDNRWLSAALAEPEPDLTAIAAQLGGLLDALAAPEGGPDSQASLSRLRDLLARPPFAEPVEGPNLIGRFFDWLFRLLARLLDPVGSVGPGPANVLGWVFGLAGLALLGFVLFAWLRGLRGALARDASTSDDDPEANLTASQALQQASSLARGGDYRTAVRYLYLSSLLWLDEQGRLRYDRALTNREYLEHLGDQPELRAKLAPIIETFDRVWYGYLPLDSESFAAYEQQVNQLRR